MQAIEGPREAVQTLTLVWRGTGLLLLEPATEDGSDSSATGETHVSAKACFPWSDPERYISIRDEEGDEVVLLRDLGELDDASRGAVRRSLAEASFVMEIVAVESVEDEFEVRHWKVTTDAGARSFQTKLDEWPREMPDGALLIHDIAGDLYRVADVDALDPASRTLFKPFVG
jgi:hypothetical protein